MATTDFLPSRESQLVPWTENFATRIVADFAQVGLTSAQATNYQTLSNAFVASFNAVNNDGENSTANVVLKNDNKAAMISEARKLAAIIQAFPGTTNQMRSELGLTVRDSEPTPIPPPALAPQMDILSTTGWTIRVRLHDASAPDNRGKPAGVAGATVFSFVGENAPADPALWKYEGMATKTTVDVEFPTTLEPGTKVWLTSYWQNAKGKTGPGSAPLWALISGINMQQAA